ncbi:MAG: methylated-DNA--[protein]-cysteine S-methyltransferase [Oscillospiraceae bacterium]|jgi:methylated-DNA-[protein]-cysteine S-methyltransferase|nr:methylated-DNA--[protein]-cysteine S-methyltransferase [Oscillospiraceae bacterium]
MDKTIYHMTIPSPLGELSCAATAPGVILVMYTPYILPAGACTTGKPNELLERLRDQLDEYFAGTRRRFDVPVLLSGTPHRLKVWDALCGVPYGKTVTYRHIAETVGSAPIAVGQAVGQNRVNILVPCHRVVGSDGSLTGYGGGLERKRFLLELEAGVAR